MADVRRISCARVASLRHRIPLECWDGPTDTEVMTSRPLKIATIGSFLGGLAVFAGVRWEQVTHWGGQSMPWLVIPIALTYFAAATLGLMLAKDGVTRWWWVPGTMLVLFGFPVDHWVGWSVVSTRLGSVAGSLVDWVAVVAPAGVASLGVRRSHVKSRGRLVPTLVVVTISAILAMRIGIDGPDLSLPVGMALLALGVFSKSSSPKRAVAFVLIAVSLGAQIPASLAVSLSQGEVGSVAITDAMIDIAVAILAFSIAPLSVVSRRLFERPADHAVVHTV